ncbi:hypothetical protein D3C72_407550 [compost metagenome]
MPAIAMPISTAAPIFSFQAPDAPARRSYESLRAVVLAPTAIAKLAPTQSGS